MPVQAQCEIGWYIIIILNIIPKSLLSGLIQFSILHAAHEKGGVLVVIVLFAQDWKNNLHGKSYSYYPDHIDL